MVWEKHKDFVKGAWRESDVHFISKCTFEVVSKLTAGEKVSVHWGKKNHSPNLWGKAGTLGGGGAHWIEP